jgi:hypothetical protein
MDKNRFMELHSRNYWNQHFINETMPGKEYCGRQLPVFNYVVMQNVILLYCNRLQMAFYEAFDWDNKTVHSWTVNCDDDFWQLGGFDKLRFVEKHTETMGEKTERQWE